MNAALVKQSLDDWDRAYQHSLETMVSRTLPKMPGLGSSMALIGVRRSGKTSMAIAMSAAFPSDQVLYYNFEDPLFINEVGWQGLDQVLSVAEQYRQQPIRCLILDEIQNVEGWERWLRKQIAGKQYHIIVTGSSAKLLSTEIASALGGRTLTQTVWPLSMRERLRFAGIEMPTHPPRQIAEVRNAMTWGSFPEVVLTKDEDLRKRLLSQYLTDVVMRDVISRRQVRNKRAFDQVLTHYLTNPASLHSYTALKKAYQVTADTAADYTNALSDAFVLFEVQRYHPNLKVQARDPKKVYLIDPGLRTVGARSVQDDTGKLLENLVYLELLRRNQTVSYYRGKQEVDFVVTDRYQPVACIQVCASGLNDEATRRREINGTLEGMNALSLDECTIITMDWQEIVEVDGKRIEMVPAFRWLTT